jgi:uncharacterized membrane protein YdjX (TVP38/TMEM64 family)
MDMSVWMRISAVVLGCLLVLGAWRSSPLDIQDVSTWLEPHRLEWYALPMVAVVFVALAMLPVTLLIAATGIAFGPLLGPLYAMTGCLASASFGFAVGRWLGQRRLERLFGKRIAPINRALNRNGTLAVFLVRKVPAPFTLSNIVVGASRIGYRDFVIGTLLGMGAFVIALAGFGYQLTMALRDPSLDTLIAGAVFVGVPLTLALVINRALRPARAA